MSKSILAGILPAILLYKTNNSLQVVSLPTFCSKAPEESPDIAAIPTFCHYVLEASLQVVKPLTFLLQLDSLFKLLIYDNVYLST